MLVQISRISVLSVQRGKFRCGMETGLANGGHDGETQYCPAVTAISKEIFFVEILHVATSG